MNAQTSKKNIENQVIIVVFSENVKISKKMLYTLSFSQAEIGKSLGLSILQ